MLRSCCLLLAAVFFSSACDPVPPGRVGVTIDRDTGAPQAVLTVCSGTTISSFELVDPGANYPRDSKSLWKIDGSYSNPGLVRISGWVSLPNWAEKTSVSRGQVSFAQRLYALTITSGGDRYGTDVFRIDKLREGFVLIDGKYFSDQEFLARVKCI